jgi:hypothetical protein
MALQAQVLLCRRRPATPAPPARAGVTVLWLFGGKRPSAQESPGSVLRVQSWLEDERAAGALSAQQRAVDGLGTQPGDQAHLQPGLAGR